MSLLAQTLHTEYISNHQYFTARKDRYQLASGKIVDPYYVVEMPSSATAMAITANNEVILVEQYRHPVSENLLELPGGFVDPGEDPATAIRRELLEETGYAFDRVHCLAITAANPGVLNNFTYLFIATGGVKKTAQQLDDNEEIKLILKPLEEVKKLLMESGIKQSMHALCLFYGFDYLGK
jgi:8-oxo-dGTP pyrophosphatase MutT (NUDIX family)